MRHSSAALIELLEKQSPDQLSRLVREAVALFAHPDGDRVVAPLLRTLDVVLQRGVLDTVEPEAAAALLAAVRAAMRGSTDVPKLCACANVLCGLLAFAGATRAGAFSALAVLLAHKYPKVPWTALSGRHARGRGGALTLGRR